MTRVDNKISNARKIFVILNLITALLGGIYGYIYLDKSVNKEANRVLYVYKQQGFDSLKDELLVFSRQPKDYQHTFNDFKQTCEFYKNIQRPLAELENSIQQVKILKGKLLNEALEITDACSWSDGKDLANVVMQSMSKQKPIINELEQLRHTKYTLKGTLVDRFPIHGLLILAIIALMVYLRKQKPRDWLKFSLHENLILFIMAVFLANTLNSLYILLIFPCIVYFGYLLVLKNKQI